MSKKKEFLTLDQVLIHQILFRIFTPLLIIGITGIGGVGYLSIRALIDEQKQTTRSMAQMAENHLEQGSRILTAVTLAAEKSSLKDVAVFMQSAWKAYGHFETIYYVDEINRIKHLVPHDTRYIGVDMSGLSHLKQIEEENRVSISSPFTSLRTGDPTVYLVRPLSHGGRLVGELNLGAFQHELAKKSKTNKEDIIFIVDQFGTLMAHPVTSLVRQQTNVGYLPILARRSGGETSMLYTDAGTTSLASITRVSKVGWAVVDQVPFFIILRPYGIAIGMLFLLFVCLWLALAYNLRRRLKRNITDPLVQLSESTNALAAGDFNRVEALASLPPSFKELKELATNFLYMNNALQARESALKNSEEKFAEFFFKSPVPMAITTAKEGRYVDVNDSFAKIMNRKREQLVGNTSTGAGYITEEGRSLFVNEFLQKGFVANLELQMHVSGGELRYGLFNSSKITIDHDDFFMTTVTDITERKWMERSVQESEQKYRNLFDAVPVGIFRTTAEGEILNANSALVRILGYPSREALLATNSTSIYAFAEDRQQWRVSAEKDETIRGQEIRMRRPDGQIIWVRISGSVSRDETARTTYYDGTMEDITERKQAEEALINSEMKLKAVVYGSPIPQFVIDSDHQVVYWNHALERLTEIRVEEIVGTNRHWQVFYNEERLCLSDLIVDGDIGLISGLYHERYTESKLVAGAYEATDYFPVLGKNGKWLYISATAIRDVDGRIIGAVETMEDITERKKAEEALQEAQQELIRKEKLAIIGKLAGIVGHEIRNPLGVMNNAVYFLKAVLPDADDTVKEYLDIIKKEIDDAQYIVSDLLDFARTKTPRIVPTKVKDFISGALGKCAIPENIAVTNDIPDTLPEMSIDPFQIGQVLHNLITNACQAMPTGGTLTIGARRVQGSKFNVQGCADDNVEHRTLNIKPEFVEISISDTGEGILPENMKKLFQPLFTTKIKGTGLGLVVCKNLVEVNGGRIAVESRLGAGTAFTIALPAKGIMQAN